MADAPRGRLRAVKLLSAVGVLAATVLAVNANVVVARWYQRWDVTSARLYTLSEPTRRILRALSEPVEVVVLLSRGDPLATGARHLLAAYGAETQKLRVRFLDPEQHPAEFLAAQQKYGIVAGKSEEGRVVTDASIVIARANRHWYITPDDMMRYDDASGRVRPLLEQALTEGIVNVSGHEKPLVCFSKGHQELGAYDAGPQGLAELRDRIEKSNYTVEERELPGTAREPLAGCRLLIVAGPRLPFDAADAARVTSALHGGMSALLLLSPVLMEGGVVAPSGLESVVALAGVELGKDLIVETDPDARLPRGLGEVFFASPKPHDTTAGLFKSGSKLELRVLVSEAQSLRLGANPATALLETSSRAVALRDLRPLLAGRADDAVRAAPEAKYVLGVARELPKPAGLSHAPRLVIVGAANVAAGRSFRDAALYGNRLFAENAVSWLAARPALVSVPEKPDQEIGLALTEESLGEVLRYVLIYMPGSAALLGAFILLRRRSVEKRSRREGPLGKDKDEARA